MILLQRGASDLGSQGCCGVDGDAGSGDGGIGRCSTALELTPVRPIADASDAPLSGPPLACPGVLTVPRPGLDDVTAKITNSLRVGLNWSGQWSGVFRGPERVECGGTRCGPSVSGNRWSARVGLRRQAQWRRRDAPRADTESVRIPRRRDRRTNRRRAETHRSYIPPQEE